MNGLPPYRRTRIIRTAFRPGQRILMISDIHGHDAVFRKLLRKARFSADDALVIVINNGLYSMTGGQLAPTYVGDAREGAEGAGFSVEKVLSAFPLRYLARAALTDAERIAEAKRYLETALDDYLENGGFHLVELLSPCPTNYRLSPKEMAERINGPVAARYPLGEFVPLRP